jgi:NADPH2:quinone reductase
MNGSILMAAQHRSTVPAVRAVFCHQFGPLDGLTIEERPSLPLGPGTVRVAVRAAGVNFLDGLFAQGKYQIKPPLPFTPGGELAGEVTELGPEVTRWRVGDRVFASTGLGAFASEIVWPAARLLPTPAGLSDAQAATFAQSYVTAWFALHERAHAVPGQTLLVLGAGGGVGLAAVDVGRHLGLHVIAAASTADKLALAVTRGASSTIDTTHDDVKARARELGGRDGLDLVYDPVGGDLGEMAVRLLREDGQLLVIGFASGRIPDLPANQVLLRNRRVTGVDLGAFSAAHPAEYAAMVLTVAQLIADGALRPVEPELRPLDQVASALQDQVDRRVTGKLALVP